MDLMTGKDLYTTGSYGKDVGVGLMSALQDAFNKPGEYYVKTNWRGNGLADTGIGYMQNPNYTNPYDYMNALSSSLYGNKEKGDKKPSELFNNLFNTQQATYPLKTETYYLPQVGNAGGGVIGDYGNAYDSFYDYSLPTQQMNFKLPWE